MQPRSTIIDFTRLLSICGFPAFRAFGFPRQLPLNLTIGVTNRCASRCQSCEIWKKEATELNIDEYEKVFRSLGRAVAWVTLSGGDQFLRADFPDIVRLICEHLRPRVINIPLNGILTHQIRSMLPGIAHMSRTCSLVLNFSIDEIGERHDELRGHRGNYEKVHIAYRFAKELQRDYPHISVGIHTVISNRNVARMPEIYEELVRLEPDAYLTEIAEERVELGTVGRGFTPDHESYSHVVEFLKGRMRNHLSGHQIGRLVESLRLEYYDICRRVLRLGTQVIPCYAGWASAQVSPDGAVWGCCVRAEPFGNLRDFDYDFRRVWRSPEARSFRASVRSRRCACPLANASYTNMLFSPRTLLRVAARYMGVMK